LDQIDWVEIFVKSFKRKI